MEPIEYKLIPMPLNEGEWIIVSDEKLIQVENNKYYLSNRVIIKTELFEGNIVQRQSKGCTMDICLSEIENIIASTKFIDKSIPLIKREQLVFPNIKAIYQLASQEEMDLEMTPYLSEEEEKIGNSFIKGFVSGYNKHAETHPFNLEMVFDFLNYMREHEDFYEYMDGDPLLLKKLIISYTEQHLQQPKKEYIVELDLVERWKKLEETTEVKFIYETNHWQPKVDKEGYINILKIK
jgi:hypothetical protein